MFSGIIERVGRVTQVEPGRELRRLSIDAGDMARELAPGASVAVDGTCLTAETVHDTTFTVTAVSATLERTIAGRYDVGTTVNLERAVRADTRLDGHIVQGHVDGIGELTDRAEKGDSLNLRFRIPDDVMAMTIEHGSIALNGVSLTVSRLTGPSEIEIALIPFTSIHTNLGTLTMGDPVNVEGDLIGKYVGRMLAPYREGRQ